MTIETWLAVVPAAALAIHALGFALRPAARRARKPAGAGRATALPERRG
ncbi:hypothetical protein [Roseomonas indoligenes]|uniref:Uncharacterized protein n=1 Tax=Roseomonas indoligenes TaxID=2820811 RepID=A0A940N0I7_9PROT|nr:hypothetical protein [Pararoseomonas indoligenes]MBP0492082.1 hypothetical protein [Pararoseomonas indoligenes]